MLKKGPTFEFDKETGATTCYLSEGKRVHIGKAVCHPDDKDMMSEKTGQEIAFQRAYINYFKYLKKNEIEPALKALKELYYTMKHSKKFNPKSYENIMLQRKIREKEDDLYIIKTNLEKAHISLAEYIDKKDLFYRRIRHNRKKEIDQKLGLINETQMDTNN